MSSSTRLYLIPGLGADARLFDALTLDEPYTVLEWIPAKKRETLAQYVTRLAEPINCDDPIILGVSFGGIAAIEMTKLRSVAQTLIVSSVKTRQEVPFYLKLVGALRILDWIPKVFLGRNNRMGIVYWYFGITEQGSKDLFREILKGSEPEFMRWAVARIGTWKNQLIPAGLLHLHGKLDRVFPASRIRNAEIVENGHHFMIVDEAKRMSIRINEVLANVPKS